MKKNHLKRSASKDVGNCSSNAFSPHLSLLQRTIARLSTTITVGKEMFNRERNAQLAAHGKKTIMYNTSSKFHLNKNWFLLWLIFYRWRYLLFKRTRSTRSLLLKYFSYISIAVGRWKVFCVFPCSYFRLGKHFQRVTSINDVGYALSLAVGCARPVWGVGSSEVAGMWPLFTRLHGSSPATYANFLSLKSPLSERTTSVSRWIITGILVCRKKSNFIWEWLSN